MRDNLADTRAARKRHFLIRPLRLAQRTDTGRSIK
jgi:hypothetical protein